MPDDPRRRPAAPISIEPLRDVHLGAAAKLVAERCRALRDDVPILPAAWSESDSHLEGLRELLARGTCRVALRDETLVAFQAAWLLDGHGGRWAWVPDAGHGTLAGDERTTEAIYAALAAEWVRGACLEHVVTVFACEREAFDTYVQLGFGVRVVDLVRDLRPVRGAVAPPGVTIRRAGPPDAQAIMALEEGLRRHLVASPVFLPPTPSRPLELHRRRLGEPAAAFYLAEDEADARVLAYLRIGKSATDVATVVQDAGTASITGAFTVAERRGEDIGTALLDAALAWAREAGFARCAVDHESANLEAARFWGRHFTPVALSLARRLQPRTG